MYFKGIKKKCHYIYHHIDNSQCSLLIKDPGFHLVPCVLDLQGTITSSLVNFFYSGIHCLVFVYLKCLLWLKYYTIWDSQRINTNIFPSSYLASTLEWFFAGYRILYWEIFLLYWKIFLSTFWGATMACMRCWQPVKYSSVCDIPWLLTTLSHLSFLWFSQTQLWCTCLIFMVFTLFVVCQTLSLALSFTDNKESLHILCL